MTKKHKAHKATLDKGLASEWNDDHIDDFADEIDIECSFITPGLAVLWDLNVIAGGAVPSIQLVDHHTFAQLNAGAGVGKGCYMRYERGGAPNNITYIDDNPIFTSAVWLDAYNLTGTVVEFGFQDNAVAPFTANQDGAYFRVKDDKLYAVTGDGVAETETDITPTAGIPEYGHYRIELSINHCYFYVDDMETAKTDNTTNLPNSDLTLSYAVINVGAVTTDMYIDAVGLNMLRYQG